MTKKMKPVLGVLWGLILGIGLAGIATTLKLTALSAVSIIIWVVVGVVLGVAWSTLGPAKGSASG